MRLAPFLVAVAIGVACVALAARAQGPARVDRSHAAVRLLHLDPARGPVNVWLDDALVFPAAGADPTPYTQVRAGAPPVRAADAASDEQEAPAQRPDPPRTDPVGTIRLDAGAYATLLLLPRDGAGEPFVLLDDDVSSLPAAGHAALRLVHARPGGPALALVARDGEGATEVVPPFEAPEADGGDHLARLDPLAASGHVPVPAGPRTLWLVREDGEPATDAPIRATLRAGTLYTLVAAPTAEGGGIRALLVVDATAPVPTERKAE